MRFAISIERRCRRIIAEADRAILMSDAGQWNPLAEKETAREKTLVTGAVLFALDVVESVFEDGS